jgi:hypothetical protein
MRKVALLAVPAVALMVVVAWLVNDIGLGALLSAHRHGYYSYGIKQTIQLFLALTAAGVISLAVSTAGSIVRMALRLGGYRHEKPEWKIFSAEGAIVGLVVVGAWLGWSPRDTYRHPDEWSQIDLRNPSLLENPLGFSPGSSCLSALIVTHRDTKGNTLVQQDYEFDDVAGANQVARCTILWGAKGTQRAIVQLANGNCLVFPEPWEDDDRCPPEDVSEAYLKGETIDRIRGPLRGIEGKRGESSHNSER